jgi:hypothetical protein
MVRDDDLILRSRGAASRRTDRATAVATASHSRGAKCVRVISSMVPHQTEGAGNAGATIAPAVSCQKHEGSHHRYAEQTGIPRAMCYGLYVISPVNRAFLPPSPGLGVSATRPTSVEPSGLIPASGDQDHTISPSTTRIIRHMIPPQPSHPAPRFETIGRKVPLAGAGWGEAKPLICPTAQAKFLPCGGSVAPTGLNGLVKLVFSRMQLRSRCRAAAVPRRSHAHEAQMTSHEPMRRDCVHAATVVMFR